MSGLDRWTGPVSTGPFRFGPGGSSPGGIAHVPGDRQRIAFLAPGQPLPDGYVWGAPPPMDIEEWGRRVKARLREEREEGEG